jgi:hypothetical protein
MPRRPDIDAAVEHIGRYAGRDEWVAHRREHLATMLGRIPEHFGLDLEGLFDEVGRLGHLPTMVGFIDEAFLAAEHGPDRANVTDDYLRRRGWQETPRGREYLQAIRTTPPVLYEVCDVAWGEWVEVRDRQIGGIPLRIVEHSGSRTLQRWDCFVARVVHPRDEIMLTGGVLPLTRKGADDIEKLLKRAAGRGNKDLAALARELGIDPARFGDLKDTAVQFADRLYFHGWLKGLLEASRRSLPTLHNTDGDPLLPSSARLPIADGAANEIARRMDALAGWEREDDEEPKWTWKKAPADPMATVLGNARLTKEALVVDTNSRERMDRALAMLRPVLGALVGEGLTSHEDITHALREPASVRESTNERRPEVSLPTDAAAMAELTNRFKEAHYRRTLDEPVPMLGNRTPREFARSKQGRKRLANWIKEIENGELRQAAGTELAPYDISWIWRELGVEDER